MSDSDRDPIDVLAEEFAQQCRQGESPSIADYVQRHPAHADQIERLFPSIALMEQLSQREHSDRVNAQGQAAFDARPIEKIGDYRIVQEIGRGGMGIVYEAVQESLGRRVAVKVLARQALLDDRHLQRFRREARTAARLHHTNVVPVFGFGEQDGYHYYVMQFIRGVGLDEVLAALNRAAEPSATADSSSAAQRSSQVESVVSALREGVFKQPLNPGSDSSAWSDLPIPDSPPTAETTPLTERQSEPTEAFDNASTSLPEMSDAATAGPNRNEISRLDSRVVDKNYWQSVARIGQQVADALHYAHTQSTLHRDIKPANLLLDATGVVWVADFGLAKALEHDNVSRTGDVVGTWRYMAPEQFRGQADARSDIYSLGLTLYELLTLVPAHEEARRRDITIRRPSESNPRIPRDLETVVLKAIAEEPQHRYQSAEELSGDLQCFLDDRPIRARRATAAERLARWCKRNPAVASLASIAILLMILVAASTSIGYWRTKAALARESTARQRAEATLGISLEALDRVYRRFAPDRVIESSQLTVEVADGEQVELAAQPVLSRETAALLEDILVFYDRFAQQGGDSVKLRTEAARANRRVGDIQQRLGQHAKAELAYLRAIERYEELAEDAAVEKTYALELARIRNELGNVYRRWQQPGQSDPCYQTALELLSNEAEEGRSSPELRFELARTHYLLAKRSPPEARIGPPGPRRGPPGGPTRRLPPGADNQGRPRPPNGPGPSNGPSFVRAAEFLTEFFSDRRAHLDKAVQLLTELDSEPTNHPEYRYLLALCYQERARGLNSVDATEAIRILETLTEQYPAVADYRYALGETHANVDPRRLRDNELEVVEGHLREAVGHADALASEHPHIPEYVHFQAHTNHKLGTVLRRSAGRDANVTADYVQQSVNYYRQAVRVQSALTEDFPEATSYRIWLARMENSLASGLREQGELEDARSVIEASTENLAQLLETLGPGPDRFVVLHSLAEQHRTLAEIWRGLGNAEQARQARQRADSYLQQLPDRRGRRGRRRPR